ncbi:MAG: hypothetical protein CMM94_06590 [Rickettsiales bacterium]|nr:hypothetical protein [Rickettsiales bacterium]|tara:strand:- start:341 stop:763 length:423 start_codon:yes stop_codon:yes gene_type:complete
MRAKRTLGQLLKMLCVLFVLFLVYAFYQFIHAPFTGAEFNRASWLANARSAEQWYEYRVETRDHCPRGAMYSDLEHNYLTVGKRKADIVTLLGEPDFIPNQKEYCIAYWLGFCSGFRIDLDSLNICFKEGRMAEVYHAQH